MRIQIVALAFAYFFCMVSDAWAYLDPATGGMILQALAAGGITALVFLKNIRNKIVSFFSSRKKDKEHDSIK